MNHFNLKPYRIRVKGLITVSGILGIGIFALVLLGRKTVKGGELEEILIHYGLIILPITILWYIFEKYGWKLQPAQYFRSALNIPPDFSGRWEGTLERSGDSGKVTFAIEIYQTLSSISVKTYSKNNESDGLIADIATNNIETVFELCYWWQGSGGAITNMNIQPGYFDGYTLLRLDEKVNPKTLNGYYFTNRKPQTAGEIQLNWSSKTLKNKF